MEQTAVNISCFIEIFGILVVCSNSLEPHMDDTFRYFCRSVACLWLILVKCLRQESFSLSTLFIKSSTMSHLPLSLPNLLTSLYSFLGGCCSEISYIERRRSIPDLVFSSNTVSSSYSRHSLDSLWEFFLIHDCLINLGFFFVRGTLSNVLLLS